MDNMTLFELQQTHKKPLFLLCVRVCVCILKYMDYRGRGWENQQQTENNNNNNNYDDDSQGSEESSSFILSL